MRAILATFCVAAGAFAFALAREKPSSSATLRHPVALALTADGRWLFTANERGGSVSIVNAQTHELVSELPVGKKLADLALTPDGKHLLAVDEEAGELILLARDDANLTVRRRVAVSPGPVRAQVSRDGQACFVTSLWERQLSIVDLTAPEHPQPPRRLPLPFAPRALLLLPGPNKVVLADAFGGRLAVFDVGRGDVESVRPLPAHNIRGLALSADGTNLLVTHQVLHRLGETTRDNVHWGNVITNNVRVLPLKNLLDPGADLLHDSRLHQVGEPGRGSGDPASVTTGGDLLAVTLAGVGEVALGPDKLGIWDRLKVGGRPTAVIANPDGQHLYVANTFGDSISVVNLKARTVQTEIRLGTPPELTAAQRGERLFYDARLAHDGWMSCHSCHTDGHTNGLLSDTLGDGSFGAPKRVLSLLGVKDTAPYAWTGGVPDLEAQVRKSVATTMHGPALADAQVRDLAAYLGSLPPPRPPAKSAAEQVRRGRAVFEKQGCVTCHAPPAYTSAKAYDVGLKDEMGQRHFNPPSLRGVGHGGTFFHDNRAAALEEVFTKHGHQLEVALPAEELRDLLVFLRSL